MSINSFRVWKWEDDKIFSLDNDISLIINSEKALKQQKLIISKLNSLTCIGSTQSISIVSFREIAIIGKPVFVPLYKTKRGF